MNTQPKVGLLAKVGVGNWITIALMVVSVAAFAFRMEGRLDMIEFRMEQLEQVELADISELKAEVEKLTLSLMSCQVTLAKMEAEMSDVKEDISYIRRHGINGTGE